MNKSNVKPVLLSINICDLVIREEKTHKASLIGMFSNIYAAKFPCIHPCLHVYITVTEGEGKHVGRLCFVNDETNKIVVELKGEIQFPNRTAIVEMNFRIANLYLEKPGFYHFEFWVDSDPIGQRCFTVNQLQQNGR